MSSNGELARSAAKELKEARAALAAAELRALLAAVPLLTPMLGRPPKELELVRFLGGGFVPENLEKLTLRSSLVLRGDGSRGPGIEEEDRGDLFGHARAKGLLEVLLKPRGQVVLTKAGRDLLDRGEGTGLLPGFVIRETLYYEVRGKDARDAIEVFLEQPQPPVDLTNREIRPAHGDGEDFVPVERFHKE